MSVETVTALVNSLIHEPQAGLLTGMLFGVKATMSKELYDALITTGTLHIIALSGMNISIIVGFVHLFLLRFVRRPIANVATSFIIIGFISFVGISPSVIRAAIMAGITLLGVTLGRQVWPLFTWILAVTIMLVLNPLWIADLSFQLSVLATLGIILFAKKCNAKMETGSLKLELEARRSKLYLASNFQYQDLVSSIHRLASNSWLLIEDDLRVTLAAQVFTIPLIVFQFQRISLIAPLSNILIGWLIGPITILGFAVVAAGLIWMPLGMLLGWIAWAPLTAVIVIIESTSKIPFASISF